MLTVRDKKETTNEVFHQQHANTCVFAEIFTEKSDDAALKSKNRFK